MINVRLTFNTFPKNKKRKQTGAFPKTYLWNDSWGKRRVISELPKRGPMTERRGCTQGCKPVKRSPAPRCRKWVKNPYRKKKTAPRGHHGNEPGPVTG